MTQPQVSKAAKTADPLRVVSPSRVTETGTVPISTVSSSTVPGSTGSGSTRQLGNFEAGIRFFHARKLKEAREQFVEAAAGPERDVAQRARLHMAMCDRRLQQATVSLGSAEDYYNYGIALINSRNVAEARTHLEKALQIAPGADHIHYALALAQALSGDVASAYDNLKRAIELEPRNRIIARQDADFSPLAHQPPFDALLHPAKKSGW
ncbi:MAG TPA: tetratricopeptide repeat protein [Candidatus Acidoferrales bacterium]|nr:tetratricopeptide repeat protein [Candidatus Acidoferrales bacterium]